MPRPGPMLDRRRATPPVWLVRRPRGASVASEASVTRTSRASLVLPTHRDLAARFAIPVPTLDSDSRSQCTVSAGERRADFPSKRVGWKSLAGGLEAARRARVWIEKPPAPTAMPGVGCCAAIFFQGHGGEWTMSLSRSTTAGSSVGRRGGNHVGQGAAELNVGLFSCAPSHRSAPTGAFNASSTRPRRIAGRRQGSGSTRDGPLLTTHIRSNGEVAPVKTTRRAAHALNRGGAGPRYVR